MKNWMRWSFVVLFVVSLVVGGPLIGQEKKTISLTLRAYDSGEFAGDLNKESIVLTENGQVAEVAGLRLVKKNKPAATRNFILLYNINEYNSKIADSVDYFFQKVLRDGDQFVLLTPLKPYTFSRDTLRSRSTEELIEAAKTVLMRDVPVGASNYLNTVEQMKHLVAEIKNGVDGGAQSFGGIAFVDVKSLLVQYRQALENMRIARKLNETLLLKIADIYKNQPGQTHLVVFFHREMRPIPVPNTMSNLLKNKNFKFDAADVFEADESKETINCRSVGEAFVNSKVYSHFLYLTKSIPRDRLFAMKDNSQDVYSMFSKLADISGGVVETTARAEAALERVCGFCDQYYVVDFYSPASLAGGTFRTIDIEIKDRKLKTYYPKGYLAE